VVDFASLARTLSKGGVPGEDLFLDHVHPTIDGNRKLALEILRTLRRNKIVHVPETWDARKIRHLTEMVMKGLSRKDHAQALLSLSKVLGWAGKYEESGRLVEKALGMAPGNPEAHYIRAVALQRSGKYANAAAHYRKAVQLKDDYAQAHSGLGSVLLALDSPAEAAACVERALQIRPDHAASHYGLGQIRQRQGKLQEAIGHYNRALEFAPELAEAHDALGRALLTLGRATQAAVHLSKAAALRPNDSGLRVMLGNARAAQGKPAAAVIQFNKAVEINPDNLGAINNLAWILATCPDDGMRDGARAVELAERAREITHGKHYGVLDTLAAAYATVGRFDQAAVAAKKAIELARAAGQEQTAAEIGDRLRLYKAGKPYRAGK